MSINSVIALEDATTGKIDKNLKGTNGAAHVVIDNQVTGESTIKGPEGLSGLGQTISYTSVAVTSAPINSSYVDLVVTTEAYISIGNTATTNDYYCVANVTYRFPITPGNVVSVVRVQKNGILHLSPVQ